MMLEILVIRKVLQSFAPTLAWLCVKWHTDNQNVARIIDVRSRKSNLQEKVKRFFDIAFFMEFLSNLNGCPDPK